MNDLTFVKFLRETVLERHEQILRYKHKRDLRDIVVDSRERAVWAADWATCSPPDERERSMSEVA